MIDKLVITVDDSGWWWLSAGDMVQYHTNSAYDLLREVNGHLTKLGFFPPPGTPLSPEPIPFHRLPEAVSRSKRLETEKEKRARLRAEAHLDEIRQEPSPEPPRASLPPHRQEPLPGTATGKPATKT